MSGLGFFNIGFGEFFFILIMAGLFLGPHRIRIVARWLGQATVKSRAIYRDFMRQLNDELDESGQEELKGALADIRRLQNEMSDLRREIVAGPKDAFDEARAAIEDAQGALNGEDRFPTDNNMIAPPLTAETLDAPATPSTNGAPAELPQLVEVEDDPA